MRRILAVILCVLLLTTTVYADNAASSVNTIGTMSEDGSCQIILNATIRLTEAADGLTFPIGTNVSDVALNGSAASLKKTNGITAVKLDYLDGQEGTFSLTIHYTAYNLVTVDDGIQYVTVPLLYGFPYPVEDMTFSVTMPGTFDTTPSFYSGYHEQDIETHIEYTINGATISGSVDAILKDSETLILKLRVPEGMFLQVRSGNSILFCQAAMSLFALLALAYWFKTMRYLPSWPTRRATVPEGVSAGHLGSYLAHKSADLSMMVIQWAQMGYLIIHMDENGRVLLYKKMEMGNERSAFEQRCFKMLFPKNPQIDATSFRFARVCESVGRNSQRFAAGFRPDSGNPQLFRIFACGVALFAGVAMGDTAASTTVWRVILMFVLGVGTAAAGWKIQEGMSCLLLRGKSALALSLLLCIVVLAVGNLCGCFNYAVTTVVWSLLTGLLAAYGGRRSENGSRLFTEIVGLRRYMCKVSKSELMRILRSNPDYYFELAPYAIALGVDKQFARRFEGIHQPACTWLVTGMGTSRTANEWYPLLRSAVDAMNTQQKQSPWDRIWKQR